MTDDVLPPHTEEAEQALLGCILADPKKMPLARERIVDDNVFYGLPNRVIWNVMSGLHGEGRPIDLITVMQRLADLKRLEEIGGLQYLSALPDKVQSPENLPTYLDLVWEKWLARRGIEFAATFEAHMRGSVGISESVLAEAKDRLAKLESLSTAHLMSNPKNLCDCKDFADAYYDAWFVNKEDSYGYQLPFKFPLRIRPSELTLFTGDNGSGKSSMLGLISICCAKQFKADEKIVIASMEVPPEITLWIMARQLLGVGKLECTEQNIAKITKALAWLNKRVLLYNFLGITDWRELLNTFRYAREKRNGQVFIVDSVMRIGIPDDDYAQQGIVAAQFADFSVKTGAHTFLVVHENKGEGRAKDRVRGSKQWTDNAHNVCGMKRNEQKAEKIEDMKSELDAGTMSQKEFDAKLEGMRKVWDSKFILSKQRYPGSQQNASRWLYFERGSLQFHEYPNEAAIDFLL
jgi:hypothetical protein